MKILVATAPDQRTTLERVLAGHEIVWADCFDTVEQLLRQHRFNFIICSVFFDDSKMFDLLRLVKSSPEWQAIPFLCLRLRPHFLDTPIAREAVAFTCQALGALTFLDVADFPTDPERELQTALENWLVPGPCVEKRTDEAASGTGNQAEL